MYELALTLGMPVYQLEREMPHEELIMWSRYFEARPVGWREDSRTALIVQSQGAKVKGEEIFPSLAAMREWENQQPDEDVMVKSLRSSAFGALLDKKLKKRGKNSNADEDTA